MTLARRACRDPRALDSGLPSNTIPTTDYKGASAMTNAVLYERDGHIATITYNRPEALNAINQSCVTT